MANKNLKRMPQHVSGRDDVWWYEEPGGLCIVISEAATAPQRISPFVIPWRTIRNALARKDKAKRPQ